MNKNLSIFATALLLSSAYFYNAANTFDIPDAILVYNENPSFTKETITPADFEGAGVTLFGASWCGYCQSAKALLNEKGIPFVEIDIENNNIPRETLAKYGVSKTIPQIFVDGVPIGGSDALKAIFSVEI
ncbi:MAG: hypothetical protein HOG22_02350 [Candidatus Marinimicrobia bacterium]|nr:hypothetical protein [Candidatus Neomarinimicrobiota bacterium]